MIDIRSSRKFLNTERRGHTADFWRRIANCIDWFFFSSASSFNLYLKNLYLSNSQPLCPLAGKTFCNSDIFFSELNWFINILELDHLDHTLRTTHQLSYTTISPDDRCLCYLRMSIRASIHQSVTTSREKETVLAFISLSDFMWKEIGLAFISQSQFHVKRNETSIHLPIMKSY